MPDPQAAHERAKRLQALAAARARAEAAGEVGAAELEAAQARNRRFRALVDELRAAAGASPAPRRVPRGFGR